MGHHMQTQMLPGSTFVDAVVRFSHSGTMQQWTWPAVQQGPSLWGKTWPPTAEGNILRGQLHGGKFPQAALLEGPADGAPRLENNQRRFTFSRFAAVIPSSSTNSTAARNSWAVFQTFYGNCAAGYCDQCNHFFKAQETAAKPYTPRKSSNSSFHHWLTVAFITGYVLPGMSQ